MGKGDRCAVFGCGNDRRFKAKYIIKSHISAFDGSNKLRFWKCRDKNQYKIWTTLLNKNDYSVNGNTRVCSNHFKYGRPTDVEPNPTLYLTGYGTKRKPATVQTGNATLQMGSADCTTPKRQMLEKDASDQSSAVSCGGNESMSSLDVGNGGQTERDKIAALEQEVELLKKKIKELEARVTLKFDYIKHSDALVKLYTGCPSSEIFNFIVDKVKPHSPKLHYYRGQESHELKKYQHSPSSAGCQRKPGPKRQLSLENEILLTLMRIRLDLKIDDLAFRFGISSPHASNTVTTMISFLSRELAPLIYWPTPVQTLAYHSKHFTGNLTKVEGIIDCTEQPISKPSLCKAQYQTYSTYKSSNTLKKLVICTKSGSISYISPSFGGCASDRYITEQCQISDKFHPGMIALVDRGFNVQDIFLSRQVRVVFPPFKGKATQFSKEQVFRSKDIAKARIHIERAIGRIKEFDLLKNELPLTLLDLADDIWIIAGAISNLQPPLIRE